MRWMAGVLAVAAWAIFQPGEASAQSLQCLQETSAERRAACAELEMDDLRDSVRYWRREASQSEQDYAYFDNQRARCRGDAACIARAFNMEIAELQVRLAPAALARAQAAYAGPVIHQLAGGSTDLHILMDRIIMHDSRAWMFNSYDRGSVRNTRILQRSGRDLVIYSDYSYNGGARGWVKAFIVNDQLSCVEYHDFRGQCRPVGAQSYAFGVTRDFVISALAQAALNTIVR